MLSFQAWVDEFGGPAKLAKTLRVTIAVAYRWVGRRGCPKVDTMKEIIFLSQGRLTFERIIRDTHPKGLALPKRRATRRG